MTEKERQLCLDMTRGQGFEEDCRNPAYDTIRNVQGGEPLQVPEPWNGYLSLAKVLYVGSNPSYDSTERFPTTDTTVWPDDALCNFFEQRFENTDRRVMFWTSLVKYTRWISEELNLGIVLPPRGRSGFDDYRALGRVAASTEIVHWKSRQEEGVRECECASLRQMPSILNLFTGSILVLLGNFAEGRINEIRNMLTGTHPRCRVIVMPHPQARGVSDEDRRQMINRQLRAI